MDENPTDIVDNVNREDFEHDGSNSQLLPHPSSSADWLTSSTPELGEMRQVNSSRLVRARPVYARAEVDARSPRRSMSGECCYSGAGAVSAARTSG
jgi:hypothetical protein